MAAVFALLSSLGILSVVFLGVTVVLASIRQINQIVLFRVS